MSKLWNIADLIDLHFFLQSDEELRRTAGEAALTKRDRLIYLAKIKPQLGKVDDIPPRILVRKWLSMRRLQYQGERGYEGSPLPGTVWRELARICQGLFFCFGLFGGVGLAGSLLLYSGTTPLNISVYFGLFVVFQMALLTLQAGLLAYRHARRMPMESTAVYLFIGQWLMRGLDGLRRRLQNRISGRRRLNLAALAGGVRQRKELAVLLIWPAFILVQLGGVGFNLGVIATTLAKVAFADIAFAWQSSLQLSADLVAGLVRWVALPWSWAVPHGYPTLAQVQGGQLVLKEGAAQLATADLVSWWPFLCCSVLVYGLLPRCLLLVLGLVRQRQALEQLHFATFGIRPLLQRMTAPRIATDGFRDASDSMAGQPEDRLQHRTDKSCPVVSQSQRENTVVGFRSFLLIPDEIDGEALRSALLNLLAAGDTPSIVCIRYGGPEANDAEIFAPVAAAAAQGLLAKVLMIQEAWQPPLMETASFLRNLRAQAGEYTPVCILLIGRPLPRTVLTPVDQVSRQIWTEKMQALGDPWIEVRSLVEP